MGNQRNVESTADDVTGKTADFNGTTIDTSQVSLLALHAVWNEEVATLAGDITVEASCDGTNWEEVVDSTGTVVTQTISGSGTYLFSIADCSWNYTRIAVDITSGTMGLETFYNAKGNI